MYFKNVIGIIDVSIQFVFETYTISELGLYYQMLKIINIDDNHTKHVK